MSGLEQQALTIVSLVVGATVSYVVGNLHERARWRRDQAAALDERRASAYAAYGRAVKTCFSMAARVAAARGLNPRMLAPSLEEGIRELDRASAEREQEWERVLLLGDAATIEAARAWHTNVWKQEKFARGLVEDATPEAWDQVVRVGSAARDRYYLAARHSLGISD